MLESVSTNDKGRIESYYYQTWRLIDRWYKWWSAFYRSEETSDGRETMVSADQKLVSSPLDVDQPYREWDQPYIRRSHPSTAPSLDYLPLKRSQTPAGQKSISSKSNRKLWGVYRQNLTMHILSLLATVARLLQQSEILLSKILWKISNYQLSYSIVR